MKFDDTPSREEREDFWLDLGPASAWTAVRQPAATATPARTVLPMVSKGPKARKTSWPRPTTTRTANRCRICRSS